MVMRVLRHSALVAFLASATFGSSVSVVLAQTAQIQLPPALQASVQSGNAQAIQQAIMTLSAGNPTQAANLAAAVVARAEQLLATNPQAAVAAAGAALDVVAALPVQTAGPQATLTTVTTAARIFAAPQAQQVAPQEVAQNTVKATQIVANPTVYSASPQAAIQAMSALYGVAQSAVLLANVPNLQANVVQLLSTASQSNALNSANAANNAQIQQILAQGGDDVRRNLNDGATGAINPSESPLRIETERNQASPT
ncbi:hypothetical protein ACFSM5_17605 [Lacibacterium aquatile]|uniref:Uncharacterized protein n=1 Tax=Lacibacterium aquatile TaxID=1168082 RepID=A0ABW5DV45_9PROT